MSNAVLDTVVGDPRIVTRSPALVGHEPRVEEDLPIGWQRLWLAAQSRPWRSLAVVAAGEGLSTARAARVLARAGASHLGDVVELIDATAVTLQQLRAITGSCVDRPDGAPRVILALGPVLESPASLALARAADAALLCVTLGETSIAEAQRTIAEIGQARFVGSMCLGRGEDR